MRSTIRADGVEVTKQMRERLDWICSKLEKMATGTNLDALHCDFVVSKASSDAKQDTFRSEITFFDGSGKPHHAVATARSPLIALDIAHDEIERTFFSGRIVERGKEKMRQINKVKEARKIARAKEPSWRVKPRGFGNEE